MEDAFRFFGFTSIEQVDRLTPKEYRILAASCRLREVDEELHIAEAAWMNRAAQATKKNGRYVYKDFKKFFPYEKHLRKARDPSGKSVEGALLESVLEYNHREEVT